MIMARPSDTFLYLLMMATITSVPPVDPLTENTNPNPKPQNTDPKSSATKGSSFASKGPTLGTMLRINGEMLLSTSACSTGSVKRA